MSFQDTKQLLIESFKAAIAAADPQRLIDQHLELPDAARVLVVGGGKAAGSMAAAIERAYPLRTFEGLVATRYGHALPTRSIRVVESGHPVPDDAGAMASEEMLRGAATLGPDDLLLVLMSGGASSLMSCPAPGLEMADLSALNRELLRSGAPITDMNIVRKHVSAISGGRLAAATKAQVLCLIISDVTGDDPSAIGSGPCAPDPSSYADALEIAARWRMQLPAPIKAHLEAGQAGRIAETPKPGDGLFARVENRVIATPHQSLEAAARFFEQRGLQVALLGDTVTGEARDAAQVYAALVAKSGITTRRSRPRWRSSRVVNAPSPSPLTIMPVEAAAALNSCLPWRSNSMAWPVSMPWRATLTASMVQKIMPVPWCCPIHFRAVVGLATLPALPQCQ